MVQRNYGVGYVFYFHFWLPQINRLKGEAGYHINVLLVVICIKNQKNIAVGLEFSVFQTEVYKIYKWKEKLSLWFSAIY